jgi:hypothetical protein
MNADLRLDLRALLDAVEGNSITVDSAEALVAEFKPSFLKPPVEDREFEEWWERTSDLQEQLGSLLERVNLDQSVGRVLDFGRVAVAAASLLSEQIAGQMNGQIGRRLCELAAWDDALAPLERAAALLEGSTGQLYARLADVLFFRVLALDQTRRYSGVVQHVPSASEAARQVGNMLDEARLNRFGASAARQLGDRNAAVEFARAAVSAAERVDWSTVGPGETPLSDYYQQLGLVCRNAGHIAEALQAYARGREAALRENDPGQAALLLSELGMTWELAGERVRGAELREQAAREAEALGATDFAARWRLRFSEIPGEDDLPGRLAYISARADEPGADLAALEKIALQLVTQFSTAREPELEAMARNALAMMRVRQERWQLAEATMRAAVDSADKAGASVLALQIRLNLSNLLGQRGRRDETLAVLLPALETGERLRADAAMNELRQALGAMLERGYAQLAFIAAVTFNLGQGRPEIPPDPDLLFLASQRSRATNLNAALALANAVERHGSPELAGRILALRASEVAIEAASASSAVPRPHLMREQVQRRTEVEQALRRTGVTGYEVPIRSIAELQASLAADEGLVDLSSIPEGVSAIVARATDTRVDLIPWRRERRVAFLKTWRRALREAAESDATPSVAATSRAERETALAASWAALDDGLWNRLVELADGFQGVSRLYIVPHQELFLLPYWQLERFAPGCRISLLPSGQAFELLRARSRHQRTPRVAVGDATLTLRGSQLETDSLGDHIDCAPVRSELLRILPGAGTIHFAGHGFFDRENPYLAGLAIRKSDDDSPNELGRADPWGRGNCEILTVAQIVATLNLPKCYLTVLSACETGLPRLHPASEFTSLPAAFLIAGSRNAIASLWPAHDAAAAVLMGAFYRVLDDTASGPVAPSTALAEARVRLRGTSRAAVIAALGDDFSIPDREFPFDSPLYLDAFQHYGPD